MVRPNKNTPEGKRASEKWRKTMEKKYGKDGWHKLVAEGGRLGGIAPREAPRFFAVRPDIAVTAGAKGGRISKRSGGDYRKKWDENKELIKTMYAGGHNAREISEVIGIPCGSVRYYLEKDGIKEKKQ